MRKRKKGKKEKKKLLIDSFKRTGKSMGFFLTPFYPWPNHTCIKNKNKNTDRRAHTHTPHIQHNVHNITNNIHNTTYNTQHTGTYRRQIKEGSVKIRLIEHGTSLQVLHEIPNAPAVAKNKWRKHNQTLIIPSPYFTSSSCHYFHINTRLKKIHQ